MSAGDKGVLIFQLIGGVFFSNSSIERIKKRNLVKQLEMISSPFKDQHRGRAKFWKKTKTSRRQTARINKQKIPLTLSPVAV